MNSTAVEAFGEEELRRLLVQLVDFNITMKRTSFEWPESVVKIKRRLDLDAFFKLQVWDDLKDSSLRRITVEFLSYYCRSNFSNTMENNLGAANMSPTGRASPPSRADLAKQTS